jgi:hypothetical protein
MLPDNDGVDDFLKSLDIPAQETCSNVPISKSMCQFPVPMITWTNQMTVKLSINNIKLYINQIYVNAIIHREFTLRKS